jgi:DNA-binding MarR family transcriptional regulator
MSSRNEKLEYMNRLMEEMPMSLPAESASEFSEHELTLAQFKAMTFLLRGPQRMGDIARHLDLSLSSVTNLVSRLEGKGLAIRSHDTVDRRVVICELTEEGRDAVTWIWQLGRRRMIALADYLDEDELDDVLRAFEIVLRAARRAQRDQGEP